MRSQYALIRVKENLGLDILPESTHHYHPIYMDYHQSQRQNIVSTPTDGVIRYGLTAYAFCKRNILMPPGLMEDVAD